MAAFPNTSSVFLTLAIAIGFAGFVFADSLHSIEGAECSLPFPRSYVVYHLSKDEKMIIDGKMTEKAWEDVEWTLPFTDIQGPTLPTPRFLTQVKMRWDDSYLYVGAYLQDTDVWANVTQHDDPHNPVFNDNDFEVFVDPDGSTHGYKEIEINAIRTIFDLLMNKPYMNGGSPDYSWEMPTMKTAVYIDGPLNNPLIPDKYWTVELALPLKDLVVGTSIATAPPKNGDHWRINFSRVEYRVHNVDGHYEKVSRALQVKGTVADNWVWSPQYTINMHLPERWGFIQFSTASVNSTKFHYDPSWWYVYTNLVQTYYAEKEYSSITGTYTPNLKDLISTTGYPEYVFDGKCAATPKISAMTYSFNLTCQPNSGHPSFMGHMRDDRLIWFTDIKNRF